MTDLTIARIEALACSAPLARGVAHELAADGTVSPLPGAGLGVDVDVDFIRAHPLPGGPAGSDAPWLRR